MKYSITKLLFSSVLALLIPLLIMQSIIYIWSRNVITKEIEDSAINNTEYLLDYLDSKVLETYQASQAIMDDSVIGMFFTKLAHETFESTSEYYTMLSQIVDDLGVLKYSNDIVEEVSLLFSEHDVFVSTDATNEIRASDYRRIISAALEQTPYFFELDNELYSVFGKPHSADIESAKMLFVIHYDRSSLSQILAAYSVMHGENACLYKDSTGYLLTIPEASYLTNTQLDTLNLENRSKQIVHHELEIDGRYNSIFSGYSSLLMSHILLIVPTEQLNATPARIGILLSFLFIVTFFIIILLVQILNKTVAKPVSALKAAFVKAGNGDFNTRLSSCDAEEFNQLASGFNAMAEHIDKLININYTQTIRLQASELKELQTQINPHFLYNSFYFLRYLISSDESESAEEFCRYLGRYFQYITRNEKATLRLKEEFDHVIDYLNIQFMRFGDTITSDIAPLPQAAYDLLVPRLILEPIVENCFKHGINANNTPGHIRISFAEAKEYIDIIIENNGILPEETLLYLKESIQQLRGNATYTGLVNTHHRLLLFYGNDSGLHFERSSLGGMLVSLRIPLGNPSDSEETRNDTSNPDR